MADLGAEPRVTDVLVLGGGMIGLSAALHILSRGRSVTLIERKPPASETSYGNAGMIQSSDAVPYMFPRDAKKLMGYALNNRPEALLRWRDLPKTAPFLFRYFLSSSPEGAASSAKAVQPLIKASLTEHQALIAEADAERFLKVTGYIRVYHSAERLDLALEEERAASALYGTPAVQALDGAGVAKLEPMVRSSLAGGIFHPESASISDPGALGAAFANLFTRKGGVIASGDATTLEQDGTNWRVATASGFIAAQTVVIALGPWSGPFLDRMGVRVPWGVKRGYHVHFERSGNASLGRPVIDVERGFAAADMTKGIRITTGAEFAALDAPRSNIPVSRVEPLARDLLPLGARVKEPLWMGARPCLPDMVPIISAVPGKPGLFASFGHHHWGFTLGPATGRLVADLVTGAAPYIDPTPYRIGRFLGA